MGSQRNSSTPGGRYAGDDELINSDLLADDVPQPLYPPHTASRQFGAVPTRRHGYGAVAPAFTYHPPMANHNPTLMASSTPHHGPQYSQIGVINQNSPHIRHLALNNNFHGLPLLPSLFRGGPAFTSITTGYGSDGSNSMQPDLPNHFSVHPTSNVPSPTMPGRTIQASSQDSQVPNGFLSNPLYTQTSNRATHKVGGSSDDSYGTETAEVSEVLEDDEAYESLYDSMVDDLSDQAHDTMSNVATARSDDATRNTMPVQVDQIEEAQDDDANNTSTQSAPTWNADIKTIDDAKQQLSGDSLVKLGITVDEDDFKEVQREDKASQQYSKQIFDALLIRPRNSPHALTDEEKALWWLEQDKTLEKCKGKIQSKADIANACSRCVVVIEKTIMLHGKGLSVLYLNKATAQRVDKRGRIAKVTKRDLKTSSKYTLDRDIKCTTRIERIVKAVRDSKQVALDVLNGEKHHIADLVRAPTAYAAQERLHFGSNKMRTEMLNDGKALREEKKANLKAEAERNAKAAEAEAKAAAATSGGDEGDDGEPAVDAELDSEDRDE